MTGIDKDSGQGRAHDGKQAERRPAVPGRNPERSAGQGAGPRGKSDVMQAALQAEAYMNSPDEAHLLLLADDADPPTSVTQGAGAADDEHDWDEVVQQTFPASDSPPGP